MKTLVGSSLLVLASALAASAFVSHINESGQVRHWNLGPNYDPDVATNVLDQATGAIRYSLAADAYSATNTVAELDAIRAAFAQWQAVPGTRLKFEEGGLVGPGVNDVALDDRNVVFWVKHSTLVNGGWDDIRGLPSVTYVWTFDDNTIVEADIVLNGVDFNWITDFRTGRTDSVWVESTLLHEIGHLLGLEHSPVGGATMLWHEMGGVTPRAGLSSDEFCAVRHLYPPWNPPPPTAGTLRGQVMAGATRAFGAAVFAEDAAGNTVAGTVTWTNGVYELPALPAGSYRVRVAPLDPRNSLQALVRGEDIHVAYTNALTSFLPTTNKPVTLIAGGAATVDFNLVRVEPAFRISHLRPPAADPNALHIIRTPFSLSLGASDVFLGVYGASLPTSNAQLTVTGDGVTVGETRFWPAAQPQLNLVQVSISLASNATPGLRSLVLQQGTNVAYANGFLEISPAFPDWNFDGLDDRFQRRYFPLFTATNAAPVADPDQDGFNNLAEYEAGTDPSEAHSFPFRITGLKPAPAGTTLTFQTGLKDRYQVLRRPDFAPNSWQPVGPLIQPTGISSQFMDPTATNGSHFYRVQAVP